VVGKVIAISTKALLWLCENMVKALWQVDASSKIIEQAITAAEIVVLNLSTNVNPSSFSM